MDGFWFVQSDETCGICGTRVGDWPAHQRFHDALAWIYQRTAGLSDEEYGKLAAVPAAERDRRLAAVAESLGIKVPAAGEAAG